LKIKLKTSFIPLLTLALGASQQVYGNLKNFSVNNENLKISTPKSWQIAKAFLNSSYTLFGPFENGRRPVISLNKTELGNYKFDKTALKKTQREYREGRLKWLKRNKGGLLGFIPYKIENWPHVGEVHWIGYNYNLLDNAFEERTYFFKCNKKVFNFSVLMTLKQKKTHLKTIESILRSTKCR